MSSSCRTVRDKSHRLSAGPLQRSPRRREGPPPAHTPMPAASRPSPAPGRSRRSTGGVSGHGPAEKIVPRSRPMPTASMTSVCPLKCRISLRCRQVPLPHVQLVAAGQHGLAVGGEDDRVDVAGLRRGGHGELALPGFEVPVAKVAAPFAGHRVFPVGGDRDGGDVGNGPLHRPHDVSRVQVPDSERAVRFRGDRIAAIGHNGGVAPAAGRGNRRRSPRHPRDDAARVRWQGPTVARPSPSVAKIRRPSASTVAVSMSVEWPL